jgi:hypothetical protein
MTVTITMKKIYVEQIRIILLQSIEVSFRLNLYQSYKEEFRKSNEFFSTNQPDYETFLRELRESLKVILNNINKVNLFNFFPLEELILGETNEELMPYFILFWEGFFPDENWNDDNYKDISFELDDKEF